MADVCPCNFSLVFFGEFVGGWLSQISDSTVIKFKNLFIKYFFLKFYFIVSIQPRLLHRCVGSEFSIGPH